MSDGKFKTWFKRVGVVGFLFFFIKGLVWLFIFYGLGTGIKGCGKSEVKEQEAEPVGMIDRLDIYQNLKDEHQIKSYRICKKR